MANTDSELQTSDNFVYSFEFTPNIKKEKEELKKEREAPAIEQEDSKKEEEYRSIELMDFDPKGWNIDSLRKLDPSLYEEWLRPLVVQFVKQFNGFGVGDIKQPHDPTRVNSAPDAHKGQRGKAYGNICFPFKGDEDWNQNCSTIRSGSYGTKIKDKLVDPKGGLSSCGLVVRSLWQLLGARHTNYINPPYTTAQAMVFLRDYAVYCGAFYGTFGGSNIKPIRLDEHGTQQECQLESIELFDPKQGDVIFIEGTRTKKDKKINVQHVFTVISVDVTTDGYIITSCDGGQNSFKVPIKNGTLDVPYPGDGSCNGIRLRKRTFSGLKLVEYNANITITGWVKVTELEFPGELIIPQRNRGKRRANLLAEQFIKYYLPEPSPN